MLQEHDILGSADWLAAVSGGSYIAGAFTMVAKSIEDRRAGCEARLEAAAPEEREAIEAELRAWRDARPFATGSPEVRILRNNSKYIAPDARHVVEIVVRMLLGLIVNVIVLGVALGSLGVALGIAYGWRSRQLVAKTGLATGSTISTLEWITLAVVAAGTAAGLANVLFRIPEGWRKTTTYGAVVVFAGGAACGAFALAVPWVVLQLRQGINLGLAGTLRPGSLVAASGVAGGTIAAGVGLQLRSLVADAQRVVADVGDAVKRYQKLNATLRRIVVHVVASVAVPFAALAAFIAFVDLGVSQVRWHGSMPSVTAGAWLTLAGLIGATALLYGLGDLTTWSMHPYYRRRLCSAYALQRTAPDTAAQRPYGTLIRLSEVQPEHFPTLVVCASANVDDRDVAPPGQRAVRFTFGHDHLGYLVPGADGWASTPEYETWADAGRRNFSVNVTLPAAIAMSGAALSPEMGYMTRPWLRALMALGNVRLGVWVPNPNRLERWRAEQRWRWRPGPPRPHHLISELLGLNSISRRYLYVTDGGHVENLGLVELLRRRCDVIWCFDAAGDQVGKFHTLGEALALAFAELNVSVDIDPAVLVGSGLPTNESASDFAFGTIRYADGQTGLLIYVRAAVTKADPWALLSYADSHVVFPGDPTLNQLYDYARFDAYHALGRSAASHAVTAAADLRRWAAGP